MADFFLFPSGTKALVLKSGPLLSDLEDCPIYIDPEELRKRYGPKFEAAMQAILERAKAAIAAKPTPQN